MIPISCYEQNYNSILITLNHIIIICYNFTAAFQPYGQCFARKKGKSVYWSAVKLGGQYQVLEQDTCLLLLTFNMIQSPQRG